LYGIVKDELVKTSFCLVTTSEKLADVATALDVQLFPVPPVPVAVTVIPLVVPSGAALPGVIVSIDVGVLLLAVPVRPELKELVEPGGKAVPVRVRKTTQFPFPLKCPVTVYVAPFPAPTGFGLCAPTVGARRLVVSVKTVCATEPEVPPIAVR